MRSGWLALNVFLFGSGRARGGRAPAGRVRPSILREEEAAFGEMPCVVCLDQHAGREPEQGGGVGKIPTTSVLRSTAVQRLQRVGSSPPRSPAPRRPAVADTPVAITTAGRPPRPPCRRRPGPCSRVASRNTKGERRDRAIVADPLNAATSTSKPRRRSCRPRTWRSRPQHPSRHQAGRPSWSRPPWHRLHHHRVQCDLSMRRRGAQEGSERIIPARGLGDPHLQVHPRGRGDHLRCAVSVALRGPGVVLLVACSAPSGALVALRHRPAPGGSCPAGCASTCRHRQCASPRSVRAGQTGSGSSRDAFFREFFRRNLTKTHAVAPSVGDRRPPRSGTGLTPLGGTRSTPTKETRPSRRLLGAAVSVVLSHSRRVTPSSSQFRGFFRLGCTLGGSPGIFG